MAAPLKRLTLAAFAAPCLPLTGVGLPLIVYLPPYYAGTLGLDLALTGIIFSAVRWIDLPLDIVFGHGIDRTDTKWGRFRPWMVIGGLVMIDFIDMEIPEHKRRVERELKAHLAREEARELIDSLCLPGMTERGSLAWSKVLPRVKVWEISFWLISEKLMPLFT